MQYPDVSHYQSGLSLRGAPLVIAKASQGLSYVDPAYAGFLAQARTMAIPFGAYHWLDTTDAAAQARHCFSVVGAGVPLMVDDEQPAIRVAHTLAFVTAYRALGGLVTLEYLPRWAWDASGRPDLRPLAAAGLHLVASDYNPSHNTAGGSAWQPYGGVSPEILQTTDRRPFNGRQVDFNTYPGTLPQLLALLDPGTVPTGDADQMLTLFQITGQPAVYVSDGMQCRWVQSPAELTQLRNWGLNHWHNMFGNGVIVQVTAQDFDALAGVLIGPDPNSPQA